MVHLLFIGNSSTYYHDMPKMVQGLAAANDIPAKVFSITAGNYKLIQFADRLGEYYEQIVETLEKEQWDYVILQDHRESIIQHLSDSREAMKTLKKIIDRVGAKTILYETQADKYGRDFEINGKEVSLEREQIQKLLRQNYCQLGKELGAPVSLAGSNYLKCMECYPEIELYFSDFRHPSIAGSYLAACSLYKTIFGGNVSGNTFLPDSKADTEKLLSGLKTEDAKRLQLIADKNNLIE